MASTRTAQVGQALGHVGAQQAVVLANAATEGQHIQSANAGAEFTRGTHHAP